MNKEKLESGKGLDTGVDLDLAAIVDGANALLLRFSNGSSDSGDMMIFLIAVVALFWVLIKMSRVLLLHNFNGKRRPWNYHI